MKKTILLTLFIGLGLSTAYAVKKRVLFLGNSYTYQNNLPQTLKDVAMSVGDTVEYDSYAPGGYTLKQHATDNNGISKIMQGNWDYVVLQDQSQSPALTNNFVQNNVFPYARILDSLVRKYNSCAETVFYMTWGYKNGDPSNCAILPPICTYEGMDSLLRSRYLFMADTNNAIVSPVGAVRRHIRSNYPTIELYDTDGAHPSVAGTYAAACSFYSVLFRKDPLNISFNSSLTSTVAANIRTAAKIVAFDSLATWFVGTYDQTIAQFSYTIAGNTVNFSNQSANASQYLWTFGDGNTSTSTNPTHTYAASGTYTVKLVSIHCNESDTSTMMIKIGTNSINGVAYTDIALYPNPVKDALILQAASGVIKELSLFNSHGALLSANAKHGSADKTVIDLSGYPAGVYYIKIRTADGLVTKKILKQ